MNLLQKLTLLLFFVAFANAASSQFAGGNGSVGSPWLIETAAQLDYVRNYTTTYNKYYFKLKANIYLNTAPWNEGKGWDPNWNRR